MTFKKVLELSGNSIETLDKVLSSGDLEYAQYNSKTKHISLKPDKPFVYDPLFWRNNARLSVYLLCFPHEYDPSLVQQEIPGVAYVRLVNEVQKSILNSDDSFDESFSCLSLNDSCDNSSGKRKPHAILCKFCFVWFLFEFCNIFVL